MDPSAVGGTVPTCGVIGVRGGTVDPSEVGGVSSRTMSHAGSRAAPRTEARTAPAGRRCRGWQ